MEGAYPSQLLEKAVCEFSKLPGIGRKTALRLVLDLLRRTEEEVDGFATAVTRLRKEVKHCKVCHNISDTDVCPICSDRRRDSTSICVVENIRDVMAVENTQQYNGLYHVLGGIISPMDGVGPSDIEIDSLVERVANVVSKSCRNENTAANEAIIGLPRCKNANKAMITITDSPVLNVRIPNRNIPNFIADPHFIHIA